MLGAALAFGIFGPDLSLWLTALPAALAALAIVGVALLPRLGPGPDVDPDGSVLRAVRHTRHAVIDGTGEARQILGSGDARAGWRRRLLGLRQRRALGHLSRLPGFLR